MTLHGIFSPTLTPLLPDLRVDIDRLIAHGRWLLDNGCHGLAVFGTTSEANSFSVAERMDVLDGLVDAGIDPALLVPGTGMCAIPDAVSLTSHAVRLGASGVLMLPPFYYKGVSDDGLFAAYSEVIQRVGDSRLRIYLYHIPPISQVGISLKLIERLVATYPDIVVGIKDSSNDWANQQAILDAFPGFGTLSGSEKFLLENLKRGGVGTITAVANVIPDRLRAFYDGWQSMDDAEAVAAQDKLNATRMAMQGYPPVPALKEMMASMRNDPAWRTVRPPLTVLTEGQRVSLMAGLDLGQIS